MKELETDGINHNHILTNPIVNGILKLETSGKITHEEALMGMVNALAERNAELEKFILDLYSGIPMPPGFKNALKIKIADALRHGKGKAWIYQKQ